MNASYFEKFIKIMLAKLFEDKTVILRDLFLQNVRFRKSSRLDKEHFTNELQKLSS